MKTKFRFLIATGIIAIGLATMGCSTDEPQSNGSENNGAGTGANPGDNSGNGNGGNAGTNTPDTSTWNLVFQDDFDGTSKTPNADYWTLAERGTDTWNRYLSESYEQAYQENGYLYLLGERVDGEYKTGAIETRGKFDFTYGKVECRAKFQKHPQGNHTGIWMMPEPPAEKWPKSGEIDIMEHLNSEDIIYETVHSWYLDDMGHSDPSGRNTAKVDIEDWNTYGLIWTENELTYTVNGEPYLSYPNLNLSGEDGAYQWPFNKDFYIILSQSLGGEGTWEGEIDNGELPSIFVIDWIKVYQKQD